MLLIKNGANPSNVDFKSLEEQTYSTNEHIFEFLKSDNAKKLYEKHK